MARYQKGLSEYEMDKKHVRSRMYSTLGGSRSSRSRKMAAIDAALGQAMDRDSGRNRTVQAEEYTQVMDNLVEGGVISEHDRANLDRVVDKELND